MVIYPAQSALMVVIYFIVSLLVILGAWVFSKRAGVREKLKRNISLGMYIFGGLTLALHIMPLWRVINGTFEPAEVDVDEILGNIFGSTTDGSTDVVASEWAQPVVDMFGMEVAVFQLISVGIGMLLILLGFIYKSKNWGKIVMLLGAVTMLLGLFQILL